MGTGSVSGVKSGRVVTLTPHPLVVPRSIKQSRGVSLLSLWVFMASIMGETYLPFHSYSGICHRLHWEANKGEKLFYYNHQIRFFHALNLPENEVTPFFENV
jgi:hypothetical protein